MSNAEPSTELNEETQGFPLGTWWGPDAKAQGRNSPSSLGTVNILIPQQGTWSQTHAVIHPSTKIIKKLREAQDSSILNSPLVKQVSK